MIRFRFLIKREKDKRKIKIENGLLIQKRSFLDFVNENLNLEFDKILSHRNFQIVLLSIFLCIFIPIKQQEIKNK